MFLIYTLLINHIAGIAGSNTAGGIDVCCECPVLSR
jgi:hypothetical protein